MNNVLLRQHIFERIAFVVELVYINDSHVIEISITNHHIQILVVY